MLNIEKYKEEILRYSGYQYSLVCLIYEDIMKKNDCTGCCSKCKRETIEWLTSEYKESILTDKEKACLKKIIKSKRDSVIYISKIVLLKGTENEFINIVIATKDSLEGVAIPDMPFEGMKLEREYSLEELGL